MLRCAVVMAVLAGPAAADPGATCDRVAAEAQSQADVLYGPQVVVDGAHVPSVTNVVDPTMPPSNGLQARVSVVVSPSDMWRGHVIERIARADCTHARTADQLDRVLAIGDRWGEIAAARAELKFLADHVGDVDALVADAEMRFEHQRATAIELDELHERRTALQLQIAERKETLAVLEQLDGSEPAGELAQLVPAYRTSAIDLEREQGSLRQLAAWRVDVRGGIAAADTTDWFAIAEVTYSIGGLWQRGAEDRAIAARKRELEHDVHDASVRVDMLRRAMHASAAALTEELAAVDDMIGKLRADIGRLDAIGDANDATHQLRGRYTIQLIQLEARRASITALVAARRSLAGDAP
jgi:hypothetical protein